MLDEYDTSNRPSLGRTDAELVTVGLGTALARIGICVFALDSRGRVIFSNPAAQTLVGEGIAVIDRRLRFRSRADSMRVDAVIATLLDEREDDPTGEPNPIVIERNRPDRLLAVHLIPIPRSVRSPNQLPTQARAIVLVVNPNTATVPDPSLVRDMLDLTPGEARIASLVGSGLPPRAAAERLGLSVETARSALKRVFEKVGVSRQSELVALMTKLLLR